MLLPLHEKEMVTPQNRGSPRPVAQVLGLGRAMGRRGLHLGQMPPGAHVCPLPQGSGNKA